MRGLIGAGFCLALIGAGAGTAWAQGATDSSSEGQAKPQVVQNPIIPGQADPDPPFTTAKQDAVLTRQRREYDPIGIEAGGFLGDIKYLGRGQILESFLLFPKVETSIVFDNNIFADKNGKVADFIGTVKPELELHSNWDNHELFVRGFGEFGRNLRNNRESFRRHGVEIGGRVDVREYLSVNLGAGWQRKTAARSDIDADTGGDEPTVFYESFGEISARYKRDKLDLRGETKMTVKDFVDTPAGNSETENDQNDNWLWENTVRIGWEQWRGTTLFAEPFFTMSRNFIRLDNSNISRGFNTQGITFGLTYDASAVTFLEAGMGFGYAVPMDGNSDSFFFFEPKLDLVWNPHDSWTFKAGWSRDISSTNSATPVNNQLVPDVAFNTNSFKLATELEITYELLASAEFGIALADTIQNDTTQTSVDTELALLWLMNEYSRLRGFWEFSRLVSNDNNREFAKHRVGLALTLQY
ncbi:MAG: outer membrane beta-barrel protein [Minwuia sp.]|uniref:outer membrane beta-barrel protein n=1 Tax=Minwuia sp. TaxID=2493630 RepID=UPI003A8A5BDA